MKSAPVAGHKWYWFHKDDTYGRTDIVDKKIIELYRKTPTGELLHDTSLGEGRFVSKFGLFC